MLISLGRETAGCIISYLFILSDILGRFWSQWIIPKEDMVARKGDYYTRWTGWEKRVSWCMNSPKFSCQRKRPLPNFTSRSNPSKRGSCAVGWEKEKGCIDGFTDLFWDGMAVRPFRFLNADMLMQLISEGMCYGILLLFL